MLKKLEASNIRGLCVLCNKNLQKGKSKGLYKPICSPCDKRLYDKNRNLRITNSKRPYRKYLKSTCEGCGFIPEHVCQLDIDHVDGDHSNNEQHNLKTLCANCHRLKTYRNKDWQ